jgi:hypothetical protein
VGSARDDAWVDAFQAAAQDYQLFQRFIHAFLVRRERPWLPENAQDESDALAGALRFAVSTVLRRAPEKLPDAGVAHADELDRYRAIFNQAAERFVERKGADYFNSWLTDSGDKNPRELARHALANYICDQKAGTLSPDPW